MNTEKEYNKYEDMIYLQHPESPRHPRMSVYERAAQFSPFSALTGYDAAVKEAARLTDRWMELDEYEKSVLDERLQYVQKHLSEHPTVTITYFQPDGRKAGGRYLTIRGTVKKVDCHKRYIVMMDAVRICLDDIVAFHIETD